MKSKVYFTREITPEAVVKLYHALGVSLPGKVAVKVHSGEKGNQNFLHPEFWKPMVDEVQGTIVECNTAYGDATTGVRDNTDSHRKLLEEHGWTKYFPVDLMDAEGPDVIWPIPNGKVLKENHLGKNIVNYDSMLVLAHFKGHPMGGYGGALKRLSIGRASRAGKALIHSAGATDDRFETWQKHASSCGLPGGHGRCRFQRGGTFPGQDRLYQCDEESFRGLRLLCGGGGSLHERHRYSGIPGSGGH
ncbi:MAG: DUF362 domain-containing protein [Lachnospiraceae bacterium]